jgi:lysozyme
MPLPNDMRLSDKGYKVLHEREGLRLTAYLDSVGVLTIGLGHTSAAGPPKVHHGMKITAEEAEEIFRRDAQTFRNEVIDLVNVSLAQHQFDALASFVFNIGSSAFKRSTTLKRLNAGDYDGAAKALMMWVKPPEIKNRRRGEYFQFLQARYDARVDEKGNAV